MADIGERLQSVRKRRGLSQRQLAQESDVSLSLTRKLEQGERSTALTETLRSLAVALDVPTMVLLGDNPEPPAAADDAIWAPAAHALAAPADSDALEPGTEHGLAHAPTAAVKLYHDNRYDDPSRVLPGLLRYAQG